MGRNRHKGETELWIRSLKAILKIRKSAEEILKEGMFKAGGENLKVEMRQDLHLWLTFDEPYKEIIVDRERGDVRIRIGNSVIKIRYKENELRDILLNDVPLQMSRYK